MKQLKTFYLSILWYLFFSIPYALLVYYVEGTLYPVEAGARGEVAFGYLFYGILMVMLSEIGEVRKDFIKEVIR